MLSMLPAPKNSEKYTVTKIESKTTKFASSGLRLTMSYD